MTRERTEVEQQQTDLEAALAEIQRLTLEIAELEQAAEVERRAVAWIVDLRAPITRLMGELKLVAEERDNLRESIEVLNFALSDCAEANQKLQTMFDGVVEERDRARRELDAMRLVTDPVAKARLERALINVAAPPEEDK